MNFKDVRLVFFMNQVIFNFKRKWTRWYCLFSKNVFH